MGRIRRGFEIAREIFEMFSLNEPTHERDAARVAGRERMTRELAREYSEEELRRLLIEEQQAPTFDTTARDPEESLLEQIDRNRAIEDAIAEKRRGSY